MTLVWMRYGSWAAHLYGDWKQLCNTKHGQYLKSTPDMKPLPAPLTPQGTPYGRICQQCLKRWKRQVGVRKES